MPALSNANTRVTNAVQIPEVWSSLVLEFQKEKLVLANLVERRDIDVASFGDKIHFPVTTAMTSGTYSDGDRASEELQANTDNEVTITIDQTPWINFVITWTLDAQSKYDIKAERLRAALHAINKTIDSNLAALISSSTHSIINSGGGSVTLADIVDAFTALNVSNVPMESRAWVFYPNVLGDLLKLGPAFTSIDYVNSKPTVDGQIGMLYGSPVYFSTNVATTTAGSPATTVYRNLYLHKQAIGLAMQKNVMTETGYDQDVQGDLNTVKTLFGYGVLRADFMVEIQR
jgi:hypothetical protein